MIYHPKIDEIFIFFLRYINMSYYSILDDSHKCFFFARKIPSFIHVTHSMLLLLLVCVCLTYVCFGSTCYKYVGFLQLHYTEQSFMIFAMKTRVCLQPYHIYVFNIKYFLTRQCQEFYLISIINMF